MQHKDGSALPFTLVKIVQSVAVGKLCKLTLKGIFLSDFLGKLQFVME